MWEAVWNALQDLETWKYLSIPVVAALVGWTTNVLALKMTFYPLEFIGIWKLGWQGIIPSKAGVMAGKAVDLLTKNLITIEERFAQIEPERVAEEMEPALLRLSRIVIDETMEEEAPLIWESTPRAVKQRIYQKTGDDLPEVVEELMEDVKENITELFDLRGMIVDALENDRELLNQIFLKVGSEEFRFIERSGLYFGFLFGIPQMVLWYFTEAGFILPLAGLIVGWATNYLALRMIFEPLRPRVVGPFTFQGIFIRRQMEVADEYAHIVTNRILTSKNIFETMLQGPASDRLIAIIQVHVKRAVDEIAGLTKPFLQLTSGTRRYVTIKNKVAVRFVEALPSTIRHIFAYAEEAMDIENTLRTKMQGLGPVEFVSFLRPVFQEDEWKLILTGAVLGFLAGLAQLIFIFGETLF